MNDITRRSFIGAGAIAALAAITGCSSSSGGGADTSGTDSASVTPATTPDGAAETMTLVILRHGESV